MNSRSKVVSRRTVLRGLGATIALPCLEIMSGKTWAAVNDQRDPARLAGTLSLDCRLGDVLTKVLQLGLHVWRFPETVLAGLAADQLADLDGERRPAAPSAELASTEAASPGVVPGDDGQEEDSEGCRAADSAGIRSF